MTDAPGASGAVWLRTLRRSPPEQARLRENGETTSARWIGGLVSQGEQPGKRGVSAAGSRRAQRQNDLESGIQGTPQTRLLRERDRKRQCLDLSRSRGVSHRQAVISGSFPLTNHYTSPGRGLNQPLHFSRKRLNQPLHFPPRIY